MNLIGKRFTRLLVCDKGPTHETAKYKAAKWLCLCDCGRTKIIFQGSLLSGATTSCGCLAREKNAKRLRRNGSEYRQKGKGNLRHGRSKTPEWRTWSEIRKRCNDPKNKWYGARGITVCERWQIFENFLADMGEKPGAGYSIEREDSTKNYEPGNCRWATYKEQARNTSDNHHITFRGETRILIEWSEVTGIKATTIRQRLKNGWTVEETLTLPIFRRR